MYHLASLTYILQAVRCPMVFAVSDAAIYILFAVFGVVGVLFVTLVGLHLLFINKLMLALQACSPRNRTMWPGLVWLNVVPILNLFWPFWTVAQVSASFRHEFAARRLSVTDKSFGKPVGVLVCTFWFVGVCVSVIGHQVKRATGLEEYGSVSTGIHMLLILIQCVLWIIYWVKITGYLRQLQSPTNTWEYVGDDQ